MARDGKRTYQFGDNKARRKKIAKKEEESGEMLAHQVYGGTTMDEIMRMVDANISRFSNFKANPNFQPPFSTEQVTIHAKLEISQPEDAHEKQADDLANAVSENDTSKSQNILNEKPADVQTKGEGGSLTTTPEFDQQLSATKGQGQSLDDATKGKLEQHAGTDLSDVKIHTGSTASTLSEGINAKAFTHGQDIYFKDGNYDPKSAEGEKLLSHEVANTVQQGNGVGRKVMRKAIDPETKKGFTKLITSKNLHVLKYTGLLSDDKSNSTYERILAKSVEIIAIWESENWYYAEYNNSAGYVLKTDVIDINVLAEKLITNEIYAGDLNAVADRIYLWYKKTQDHYWGDLSPGIDKERQELLKSIPENLGYGQRKELEKIMEDKYGVLLHNILYMALRNERRKSWDPKLFQALYRTTQNAHYETDSIKLVIRENTTVTQGATVNYAVKPKTQYSKSYPAPQGEMELYDWVIWYPDGDVKTINKGYDFYLWVNSPELFEREFDLEQTGLYRIGAIVSDKGRVDMLLQTVNVRSAEEMVNEESDKIGEIPPGAFDTYRMQYVLQANLAQAKMTALEESDANSNANSGIKQNSGANPYLVHNYEIAKNFGFEYELETEGKTKQVWYVIPYDEWVLPIRGNSNGVCRFAGDVFNVYQHDLANGQKAFSPYKELKPEDRKKINIAFPALWISDYSDIKYRLIAEVYDEKDSLIKAHQFIQYFRGADSQEIKNLKSIRDKSNEQVNRINEFSSKISGEITPLKAIYLNEETGNTLPISLFYGKDKNDLTKTRLLDLTIGVAKSSYTGDDLNDAIYSYNYRQSYPDGHIYIYTDTTKYTIETNGGSLVERFTTWSGWLSTLAFAGGVLAMFTGQEYLVAPLFKIGLVAGAVSSALSIYDQLDNDKIDFSMIAIDLLSIASSIVSNGALGRRAIAQTTNSLRAAKSAQRLFAVAMLMDGGSVLIMTGQSIQEINAILDDHSLSGPEQTRRIMLVLSRLLLTGTFFLLSNEEIISTRNELESKGVPGKLMAELEKDQVSMLKVNRLTKEEIEQALKDGEDLITKATIKEEMLIKAQQEKAVNDVFVNRMFDKFNYKKNTLKKVGNGVYDDPNRPFISQAEELVYKKELTFAEEICLNENRELVLAPHKEPGIDGFDLNTGKPIQMKELDSNDKLITRINESYSKSIKNGYLGISIYIKTKDITSNVEKSINRSLKTKALKIQNNGVAEKFVIYCSDGEVQLNLTEIK